MSFSISVQLVCSIVSTFLCLFSLGKSSSPSLRPDPHASSPSLPLPPPPAPSRLHQLFYFFHCLSTFCTAAPAPRFPELNFLLKCCFVCLMFFPEYSLIHHFFGNLGINLFFENSACACPAPVATLSHTQDSIDLGILNVRRSIQEIYSQALLPRWVLAAMVLHRRLVCFSCVF